MVDLFGSVADWLGVLLTVAAIIIGLWVAKMVSDQSNETYARERYQALVDLSVEIIDRARSLTSLSNDRWSDLLSSDLTSASRGDDDARRAAIVTLGELETRVESLVLTAHLMPMPRDAASITPRVRTLQRSGAWLVGDVTNSVINHFSDDFRNEPVPAQPRAFVETLVEQAMQNVSQPLLFVAEGYASSDASITWREPGSRWPALHARRVDELLRSGTKSSSGDWARSTNVRASSSLDEFRDALVEVISAYASADPRHSVRPTTLKS